MGKILDPYWEEKIKQAWNIEWQDKNGVIVELNQFIENVLERAKTMAKVTDE